VEFFEHWFAVSPDGGNGFLELAYVATAVAVLVAVAARRPLASALRKLSGRAKRRT
jgi:hypothetical protein